MDLGYDPYAWFDPEVGRPERRRLFAFAGVALGRGMSIRQLKGLIERHLGHKTLSEVPLDALATATSLVRDLELTP